MLKDLTSPSVYVQLKKTNSEKSSWSSSFSMKFSEMDLEQLILGKTENSSDQLVECGVKKDLKKTEKRLKTTVC